MTKIIKKRFFVKFSGYIYNKISLVNQTILSRQAMAFSAFRAMTNFQETLISIDGNIRANTEEIMRLIERDRSCFSQQNIVEAFRDMALGKNKEANTIIERQASHTNA